MLFFLSCYTVRKYWKAGNEAVPNGGWQLLFVNGKSFPQVSQNMEYVQIIMKLEMLLSLNVAEGYRLAMLTDLVVQKQVKDKCFSFILDPSSD